MFQDLSDKLVSTLRTLKGQGRITEANIDQAFKDIRMALLEADVNFKVVKNFMERVRAKALGERILDQVTAGQQFTKIIHDELVSTLGGEASALQFSHRPSVIMLVGLQGVGKTTTAAKLALMARQKFQRKPGLVPLDVYRPAARDQLRILAKSNDFSFFEPGPSMVTPMEILMGAKAWAHQELLDVVILDTAGRLQVHEELMAELESLSQLWPPQEKLLVVDAMLGQQSVSVAEGFHVRLQLTGLVMTKMDGDARGGAALSVREMLGIPIKCIGVGEKVTALETFYPDRLASRILDMGDVVTLVEKAKDMVDEKQAKAMAARAAKNQFTLDDFLSQLQMMKKLGGMESILRMLPGAGQALKGLPQGELPHKEFQKMEAILGSMTKAERADHRILNGSRRLRIAKGSGTQVSDINRFVKQFETMKKMMGPMLKGKGGMFGRNPFF